MMYNTLCFGEIVGCKPHMTEAQQTAEAFDFDIFAIDTKAPLVEFEVILGDYEGQIPVGGKIFTRPTPEVPIWQKEVYELNGEKLIFVPKSMIVAVRGPS